MSCWLAVSACRSSRCWSAAARPSSPSWPQRHGITDYTTDLDAALADPRWEIYADFLVTKARAAAIRKAIAAGKAIYTEKPTAESVEEALGAGRAGPSGGDQERRRARQALPARSAEAAAPDRLGLLRPHPLGARRVRLLGLRGRLAARAAAELELPRRGRRRHRRRHVPALELRAGEPVRTGPVGLRQGRHPHPHPRRRGGRRPTPRPRTTPPTGSSSSTAA